MKAGVAEIATELQSHTAQRVRALEKEALEEKTKTRENAEGGSGAEEIASLRGAATRAENRALEAEETVRRAEARRDVETAALESRVRITACHLPQRNDTSRSREVAPTVIRSRNLCFAHEMCGRAGVGGFPDTNVHLQAPILARI